MASALVWQPVQAVLFFLLAVQRAAQSFLRKLISSCYQIAQE
jgi:hypothetical protein